MDSLKCVLNPQNSIFEIVGKARQFYLLGTLSTQGHSG